MKFGLQRLWAVVGPNVGHSKPYKSVCQAKYQCVQAGPTGRLLNIEATKDHWVIVFHCE